MVFDNKNNNENNKPVIKHNQNTLVGLINNNNQKKIKSNFNYVTIGLKSYSML